MLKIARIYIYIYIYICKYFNMFFSIKFQLVQNCDYYTKNQKKYILASLTTSDQYLTRSKVLQ